MRKVVCGLVAALFVGAFAVSAWADVDGTAYSHEINISANAVDSTEVIDGGIGSADIGAGRITTTHILDGTVASADLATGAAALANMAVNSVDSTKVVDGGLGSADIGTGRITTTHILDGTIGVADIATDGVGAAEIAANAVTGAELARTIAGTVVASDSVWLNGAVTIGSAQAAGRGVIGAEGYLTVTSTAVGDSSNTAIWVTWLCAGDGTMAPTGIAYVDSLVAGTSFNVKSTGVAAADVGSPFMWVLFRH